MHTTDSYLNDQLTDPPSFPPNILLTQRKPRHSEDIFKEDRYLANHQILIQEDLRYVCIIKMEINLPF